MWDKIKETAIIFYYILSGILVMLKIIDRFHRKRTEGFRPLSLTLLYHINL